jgi:hypothetical protein
VCGVLCNVLCFWENNGCSGKGLPEFWKKVKADSAKVGGLLGL